MKLLLLSNAVGLAALLSVESVSSFAFVHRSSCHSRQHQATALAAKKVSFKENARKGLVSGINQVSSYGSWLAVGWLVVAVVQFCSATQIGSDESMHDCLPG
jgi:uncharacterized membrane protein YraQ (UPF0718 family)